MKKFIFMLMSVFMFTACDHDIQTLTPQEVLTNKYNAAFIATFGKPTNNQYWGFGDYILPTAQSRTRAANVNGNLWYQEWQRPTNITAEEIAWAKEEFGKVREGATHTEQITWPNYWVQQVYQGQRASTDGNGNNVLPKDKMNQLVAFNTLKEEVISWWPKEVKYVEYSGDYEHVNNFNNATNTTVYTDDVTGENFNGTTLMTNMKSDGRNEQFGYHNTADSKYHFEYIVLEHNGSFFIGFDLYAVHPEGQEANKNMDIDRDWIFDDWIVKISPANKIGGTPDRYTVRIIAEDLHATQGSDFDFNDVVFDASYQDGVDKTYITIQAAGGTLPLFVQGKEVHQLFAEANPNENITTTTMINTNNGTLSLTPVSFSVDGIIAPWDITVAVKVENELVPLKAETGNPTAKIAVDANFEWCNEREDIRTRYPNFSKYVKDTTVNWY